MINPFFCKMTVLSKQFVDCSCYGKSWFKILKVLKLDIHTSELGHTWSPSCRQAFTDVMKSSFRESFKIYATLYIVRFKTLYALMRDLVIYYDYYGSGYSNCAKKKIQVLERKIITRNITIYNIFNNKCNDVYWKFLFLEVHRDVFILSFCYKKALWDFRTLKHLSYSHIIFYF